MFATRPAALGLLAALALLAASGAPVAAQPDAPLPCAPTGFAAHPLGVVIHLQWDETPGATGYNIYRGELGTEPRLAIGMGPSNETIDTQVEQGVTYVYRITALVAGIEMPDCGEVEVTAGGDRCAPEISLFPNADGSINVSWTGVVLAEHYNLYRSAGDGELELLANVPSEEQSFLDDTTEPGGTYAYEVRAVIGGSERPACGQAAITAIPEFPGAIALAAGAALGVAGFALARRRKP